VRSRRFKKRSSQKIVVNGVRVDAAYLKEQAEKEAAEKEALRLKRIAVQRSRRRKPRPKPEPVVEVVEEVPEPAPEPEPVVVAEETGDVKEDE
jgi:hypothetical protein